jgi:DNA polymerase
MIAIDFETYYDKKKFSVTDLGPEAYANDALFDAYLLSVRDRSRGISFVGDPKDFNWELLDGQEVVAHNAEFEWQICRRLTADGIIKPNIKPKAWIDTADIAAYNFAPRGLAGASQALLGVTVDKGMRDKMSGVTWQQAKIKGWADDMIAYGLGDAERCLDIAEKYYATWPQLERDLSVLTRTFGRHGVAINQEYLAYGIDYMVRSKFKAEQGIPWEWDADKTPLASSSFAAQCRKEDIPVPASLAEDDPRFLEWDAVYGEKYPWAMSLRIWRKANSREKKLRTIALRLRRDGTVPTYLLYFGAHTGRWSGTGGINWQNLDRDPFVSFGNDPDFASGFDIRALIVPRPGNKLFNADLSQIEPRCLNWLAGNKRFLVECQTLSPYTAYARLYLGWKGGDELKTQNKDLYKTAKAIVLGAGYGCGGPKFAATAEKLAGLKISTDIATQYVASFRAANPLITGFWKRLQQSMVRSACGDRQFEIELPNGRSLKYFDVTCLGRELKARDEINGTMYHYYGGKLTENVTQAVARDVFAEGLWRLGSCGVMVPITIHDEILVDAPEDTDPRDLEHEFAQTPQWLPGTPITCEINVLDHYTK